MLLTSRLVYFVCVTNKSRTGLKQQSQISKQMSDCSHNAITLVGYIRSESKNTAPR